MKDLVLKYPTWQEPYRAAVIETNAKLLKQKISGAQQAAMLRFKELENSSEPLRGTKSTNRRADSIENTRRNKLG
jgi:hypothetical protein